MTASRPIGTGAGSLSADLEKGGEPQCRHVYLAPWTARRDEGQGLAGYALILALIAIVAIVALIFLGSQVAKLSAVGNSVNRDSHH